MITTRALLTLAGLSALCTAHGGLLLSSGEGDNNERKLGLTTANGLITANGVTSVNGFTPAIGFVVTEKLSLTNGMTLSNGAQSLNGLATTNGLKQSDGLTVNCHNKTYPQECTSKPDGLLSANTGLMRNEAGVMVASYLIRCALPSTSTIKITNWDGMLVELHGEVGVAPEWEEDLCDLACQEKVSACLLALTNDSGTHTIIEMTSPWHSMGTNHDWNVCEGVFFGNLFMTPPYGVMAACADYAQTLKQASEDSDKIIANKNLLPRSCNLLNAHTFAEFLTNVHLCPVKLVGSANSISWPPANNGNICKLTDNEEGTATECFSDEGPENREWTYPITTWLNEGWITTPKRSRGLLRG
jgi:hypothetical protein